MQAQTSVIIPCYNTNDFLTEALESVRGQSSSAREIIVIDDGSRLPVQVPHEWDGPPLRVVRTPNKGPSAARNLGILLSSGSFVAFLDADDAWAPTMVQSQEQLLQTNPDAAAVFALITEKPGWLPCTARAYPPADCSKADFCRHLWKRNFIQPSGVAIRRSAIEAIGGFDENFRFCEDYECWFRLLRVGRFLQVPLPLCYYRMHDGQATKATYRMIQSMYEARRQVIARNQDILEEAGLSRHEQLDDLYREYRDSAMFCYFRRELSIARRLLWRYLCRRPRDLQIWKYAMAAMLPHSLLISWRDGV